MSMSIRLGDFLYKNLYGVYRPAYFLFKNRQDAFEIGLIKNHVRNGDVVLDIGANIGFFTLLLSRLAGNRGKVHCFEPDELNFTRLEGNCRGLSNVNLNRMAVGSRTGSLSLYRSKDLNVDHRTYKPEVYDGEVKIQTVCIDDYMRVDPKVDFIKMDIQGYEHQAVKGMLETLRINPGVRLLSELWPYGLSHSGSSTTEYIELLTELGFSIELKEDESLTRLSKEKVEWLERFTHKPDIYFNILATKGHR